MAFRRVAKALASRSNVEFSEWMEEIRENCEGAVPANHVNRIAKTVLRKCDPKQYLLSHATIVASVDTYAPKNVKLGRQMVDGVQIDVRWPDYLIKPECHSFINNNCCPPGTMILMGDGTEKPIENIQIGDEVITHTGNARKVTETFIYPHRGQITSIRRRGDTRRLVLTGEHPVHSNRPKRNGAKTYFDERNEFEFVSAGLLQKYDLVHTPKINYMSESDITPGKAKLIGYFLAEGYYYKQNPDRVSRDFKDAFPGINNIPCSLKFALCVDEVYTLASDIVQLLKDEFNVEATIEGHDESHRAIEVTSKRSLELVQFFLKHCGEKAKQKRVSQEVLGLDPSLQKLILQCWLEGDGTVKQTLTGWLSGCTASPALASQLIHMFHRCGIAVGRYHKKSIGIKRVKTLNGGSAIVTDHTKVCESDTITINSVDASRIVEGSWLEQKHKNAASKLKKHNFLSFRDQPDKIITQVLEVQRIPYDGQVHNFETEIDHSYVANGIAVHNSDAWERSLLLSTYRTFVGACNYLEHIQLPALSKGFIVDAIARDTGNSCYIDILVATDRKHTQLISDILSGKISSYSMGCVSLFTTCTRCGNVAADDSQICACIQYLGKGTNWLDNEGNTHKISELIGHVSVPNSNTFIEASWVRNPAFRGAVRRNLLNADMDNLQLSSKIDNAVKIFDMKAPLPAGIGIAKAASMKFAQDQAQDVDEDLGDLDAMLDQGGSDQGGSDESTSQDDSQSQSPDDSDKSDSEKSDKSKSKSKDPIDDLLNDAQKQVLQILIKSLSDKLEPKPEDVGTVAPPIDLEKPNDSLVHSSDNFASVVKRVFAGNKHLINWSIRMHKLVHEGGAIATRKAAVRPVDLIVLSWVEDRCKGRNYPDSLYKIAMHIGSTNIYPSERSHLAACTLQMGRPLTKDEQSFFIRKGKIASFAE